MLLYLSTPFTHPDPSVRLDRYQKSCRVQARLIEAGIACFNPLAHSVPAVELGGLTATHAQFMALDLSILRRCDELLVVGLDGWTESVGVRAEMFEALALGLPVTQIEEADIERLPAIPKSARKFLESKILTETADG
ncbi:MAG TPA: hypothetical protein DEB39_09980 [Planctomycetaceae bacterium]|nr:hypothetical protein [Planctomycetaceae bacterium]